MIVGINTDTFSAMARAWGSVIILVLDVEKHGNMSSDIGYNPIRIFLGANPIKHNEISFRVNPYRFGLLMLWLFT